MNLQRVKIMRFRQNMRKKVEMTGKGSQTGMTTKMREKTLRMRIQRCWIIGAR